MKFLKIVFLLSFVAHAYGMENQEPITISHQFKLHAPPTVSQKQFKADVSSIALIPKHQLIAGQQVNFKDNTSSFVLYSTQDGQRKGICKGGLSSNALGPATGSSGTLFAATDVHRAVVFDLATQQVKQTIKDEEISIRTIYLSSDEKELLLGYAAGGLNSFNFKRYDINSNKLVGTYEGPYRLLSPDRTIGAIIQEGSETQCSFLLQTLVNKKEVGRYTYQKQKPYNQDEFTLLSLSSNNKMLAASNWAPFTTDIYPEVVVANYQEGMETAKINNVVQPMQVIFDEGTKHLVVGSCETEENSPKSPIYVYELPSGKMVQKLVVPQVPVNGVDLEGSRLAASWNDEQGNGVIQVWNNFNPTGEDDNHTE